MSFLTRRATSPSFHLNLRFLSFIAASANINDLDRAAEGFPIVRELQENFAINYAMSNSFGFGGTNATLIFQRISE